MILTHSDSGSVPVRLSWVTLWMVSHISSLQTHRLNYQVWFGSYNVHCKRYSICWYGKDQSDDLGLAKRRWRHPELRTVLASTHRVTLICIDRQVLQVDADW